ncbi:MAG: carbohydrate binding domain-containing protein, partial [Anaerolineae bacterium]
MMNIRPILSIGLALLLILVLCTAFAGQAMSMSDYTLSTSDGLSVSLSADGQVTSVQIAGDELVSVPAPALLLRDLSHAGHVTATNLVANPGFEDGLAGWVQYVNSGLDVNVVVSPTHTGDGALQFARSNDEPAFAAYVGDPVTVVPGQRYRVSAWWRSATGYVSTLNGPPTLWQMTLWRDQQRITGLYVQWFDAHEQRLGDPLLAVPLHWNAANWRLTRRELEAPADAASARIVIGAKLSAETLWVDDVALVPSPEQEVGVAGTVRRCSDSPSLPGVRGTRRNSGELGGTQGNSEELGGMPRRRLQGDSGGCLVQAVSLPDSGLVISVTYTAHGDHIDVHGEIADTTGRDRALDVTWGVPTDLEGWTWWDDAHTSRSITDTRSYANAISAIYDAWLPVSLYPYAGISQSPISNLQ